jgi:hypothetical protein
MNQVWVDDLKYILTALLAYLHHLPVIHTSRAKDGMHPQVQRQVREYRPIHRSVLRDRPKRHCLMSMDDMSDLTVVPLDGVTLRDFDKKY